jgi:nanoRNase/pAp phosphatase (c-di-AMP/oligoRNAs hydrolase)
MGKSADITIPDFEPSQAPTFLKGTDMIQPHVGAMRTLQITLDVSKTPIDEFLYDVRDGKLEINIVPKQHEWNSSDVVCTHGKDRYDLVITLDAPDMASLGPSAMESADFFYRTTIINIAADATNEHWGQINLVDLNAVSVTEALFSLFSEWNEHLIESGIATALLAGMMAKTRGFRTRNVTPQTLAASSRLVAMGAKRADIVDGLWRTRSVSTLKLWGRALARLRYEAGFGIVWTMLSHKDFIESGTGSEALPDVIDELISTSPDAKITALIYEHEKEPKTVCVTIATAPPHNAIELARELNAVGTRDRVTICLRETSLIDGANRIIDLLKKSAKN